MADINNALTSLNSNWFPRLSFDSKVPCTCGSFCEEHKIVGCVENDCLHLIKLGRRKRGHYFVLKKNQTTLHSLYLDEALTTPMIWCGYKQINTISIQKQFSIGACDSPGFDSFDQPGTSSTFSISPPDLSTTFFMRPPSTRSRMSTPTNPSWLRGASKLLDSGFNHDSWRQLGELLGYKELKLEQFEGSYQPSRSLLKDWLESCGSTLGTEMLLACLNEMKRFDVVDVIVDSEG